MNLKTVLVTISLMVVMAFMGAASACPCAQVPTVNTYDQGTQPVGYPICIQAPVAPAGETWGYQWEVYIGGQWKLLSQLPYLGVTATEDPSHSKICVTPSVAQCGQAMGARVTITTTTDLSTGYWDGCLLLLCVQWEAQNPACPTMTSFCQGHATAANMPQGESTPYTYTYTISGPATGTESAPGTAMTLDRLNGLTPGTYTIQAYTTVTGNTPTCTTPITIKVYAPPTGGLTFPSS